MTQIQNMQERLAAMDDAFKAAPAAPSVGEMPEDGDYQALVERFDFFEGKNGAAAGVLFLKTEMKVVHDSKYEGWPASTIHNLEDPEKFPWVKKHLATLGVEIETLSELHAALEGAIGVPVDITIKTSDRVNQTTGQNYVNVFVNRRLGGPISDVASDTSGFTTPKPMPVAEDSIPF